MIEGQWQKKKNKKKRMIEGPGQKKNKTQHTSGAKKKKESVSPNGPQGPWAPRAHIKVAKEFLVPNLHPKAIIQCQLKAPPPPHNQLETQSVEIHENSSGIQYKCMQKSSETQ